MRASLSLLIVASCMAVSLARAQTAAPEATRHLATQPATTPSVTTPSATTPSAATQSAAAQPAAAGSAAARSLTDPPPLHAEHSSRHSRSDRRRSRSKEQRNAAGKSDGVLALGATDITGNKELPKVMVIVPWKDSLGAGGVVKPTDSLLDEALQPVDRGVFQRQIHYYGQLHAGQQSPAASKVAPVGDSQ